MSWEVSLTITNPYGFFAWTPAHVAKRSPPVRICLELLLGLRDLDSPFIGAPQCLHMHSYGDRPRVLALVPGTSPFGCPHAHNNVGPEPQCPQVCALALVEADLITIPNQIDPLSHFPPLFRRQSRGADFLRFIDSF